MGAGRPSFSFHMKKWVWEWLWWMAAALNSTHHSCPFLLCMQLHDFLTSPLLAVLVRQGTCPRAISFHFHKIGIMHPFLKNALRIASLNLRTGVEMIATAVLHASTCFVTVSHERFINC